MLIAQEFYIQRSRFEILICKIVHHVAVAQEAAEGAHGVGDAPATLDHSFVSGLGIHIPLPSVLEGHDLRTGARAVLFGEENVIVLTAVERRVEVDEIDGFVLYVFAQHTEVITVIELIFLHRARIVTRLR